jgi:phosphatidylethanolamine/phosphatidyl-N-methylethanolamine N-methyltransferase
MLVESKLLLIAWLKGPLRIGTVVPSGPDLAAAVAAQVPSEPDGPVIELGGGTGPLTEAFLDAGVRPSDLVVIERDPRLFRYLANRHPDVTLIEGDAAELGKLTREVGVTRARAVVSSLPIVWMSARNAIVEQSFALLGSRGGPFIQVTNWVGSPLSCRDLGIEGQCAARLWSNLPPSSVWTYHRPGTAPCGDKHGCQGHSEWSSSRRGQPRPQGCGG